MNKQDEADGIKIALAEAEPLDFDAAMARAMRRIDDSDITKAAAARLEIALLPGFDAWVRDTKLRTVPADAAVTAMLAVVLQMIVAMANETSPAERLTAKARGMVDTLNQLCDTLDEMAFGSDATNH